MPDAMLVELPDLDMVLGELRDLLLPLRTAVVAARSRMNQNPVENRALHRPTTMANGMVDYMVAEAKTLFAGQDRVFFRDDEETWLVVDQRYDLRFKKLANDGVPQNTDTGRQRRITLQSPLPGFHLIRLNVGWGEDHSGEFRVLMSFNTGFGAIGWCVEIREDGVYSLVGNPILPFDGGLPRVQPPADPFDLSNPGAPIVPARRVRPRTTPQPDVGDVMPRRVKPSGSQAAPDVGAGDAPARKSDE